LKNKQVDNEPNNFLRQFFLNLPEAMWTTYPSRPKFYLQWFNEYTHENPKNAVWLDKPLADVLINMDKKGFLDNTFTIIMGDHGNRYDA
jgi:membrane-anchored protein YejM (alkaline phosphatase superfamily)